MKEAISFLNLAVLAGGKNFARNFWAKTFQVVILLAGKDCNQFLALSQSEKGNRRSRTVSFDTLLCLKVSQISKKLAMCAFGSSVEEPSN